MESIQFRPTFIKTKSVRDLSVMMDALALGAGEGRMGGVCSVPGRGKTVTAEAWVAKNDAVYFRVASIWKKSELDFIQALCRELGIVNPPSRKGKCYLQAIERLVGTDRAVFIDEMQRLPRDFLNIVLDLSDATACPFVLIGEPELRGLMEVNKRVWSRTFRFLEFEPIGVSDVMFYGKDAANLKLSPEVAGILFKESEGDFRILKRSLLSLVQFINAQGPGPNGEPQVTAEMARIAVASGLKGR